MSENEEKKQNFIERNFYKLMAVLVVLLIGAILLHFTYGIDQDEEENSIEDRLTSDGWILYTTSTCPVCQKQKGEFADISRLNIIECDSDEKHYNICMSAGIRAVPTWYNMNTNTTIEGYLTIDQLEELLK